MKDWRKAAIRPKHTIREALEAIDRSSLQIALVIDDEGRLLGTITDGDIRRSLLRGGDLSGSVDKVMNAKPLVANTGMTRTQLGEMLRRNELHHLPVVDAKGRVIALESDVDLLKASARDNWVVLMAGGMGQRLRPLTESTPKPLLPIGNRPLLEITIERLNDQGFRHFFISVNYLANQVEAHFGDGTRFGADIRYLREEQPLGTAGAVSLLPEPPREPFIVMNGDLLTSVPFDKLVEFHEREQADATVCVRSYIRQIPYGVAEIKDDRVLSIVEKPHHQCFISAGIYVLSPRIFARLTPHQRLDMPELVSSLLAEGMRIAAFPVTEYWIDIGSFEDLERAREQLATPGHQ